MSDTSFHTAVVVPTERGLTIAGTRITLYDVLGYIKSDWPATLIKDWLNLSDRQITGALDYIAQHKDEVEAEYNYVLRRAQENRAYWEERNKARFAAIAASPPPPGREEVYAKIQAHKAAQKRSG